MREVSSGTRMFATALLLLQGTFQSPRLVESSGVAVSHAYRGVLWTHNDSGDGPYLYATSRRAPFAPTAGWWRCEPTPRSISSILESAAACCPLASAPATLRDSRWAAKRSTFWMTLPLS